MDITTETFWLVHYYSLSQCYCPINLTFSYTFSHLLSLKLTVWTWRCKDKGRAGHATIFASRQRKGDNVIELQWLKKGKASLSEWKSHNDCRHNAIKTFCCPDNMVTVSRQRCCVPIFGYGWQPQQKTVILHETLSW